MKISKERKMAATVNLLTCIIIIILMPNGVKCQRAKNTCWNG